MGETNIMSNTAFPMKSTCVLGCLITSLCVQAQTEESIPKAEELVVTGQKVERSLQDTPASVAVLTEGFMEDQQIDSFYGLLDRVPNVHGTLGSGF